jgi:RNA polymerase sigma-70 factor (ECF subfamily)
MEANSGMLRDATDTALARGFSGTEEAENVRADFAMDEDSFRAFYDRTARGLWAYLARVTGDRQAADDLLQEAFYRFLRARSDYDSEAHRRNALYRIATNLARDARRRTLVRPVLAEGADVESVADQADAGALDRRTDVGRAMARLNPNERAMLWLAYAEGQAHSEIAERLGVQVGSLKTMLFRARRKMAGILAGIGVRDAK